MTVDTDFAIQSALFGLAFGGGCCVLVCGGAITKNSIEISNNRDVFIVLTVKWWRSN